MEGFHPSPRAFEAVRAGSADGHRKNRTRLAPPRLAAVQIGVLASALLLDPAASVCRAQLRDDASAAPAAASPAVDNPLGVPDLRKVLPPASDAGGVSASVAILVLMTVLSLAPAILVMMTSFTRIVIVLSLLRQAIGTQQLPPSQVIVSFALILTGIIMAPTWGTIQRDALDPYMEGRLSQREALARAGAPLRDFMIRQIKSAQNEDDVYLFVEHSRGRPIPADEKLRWEEISLWELTPAFVLGEMKIAFLMGFRMYLPFLVVDMVISAILISMGMLMLPPVLISLPFKLLLFVLADGWHLVVASLLAGFS